MLFKTTPLQIIDLPAAPTHFTKGRAGYAPQFILIHHTGGRWSGPWLTWQSIPAVSCHRLITKPGTIFKVVKDEDTAYCAGFGVVGPIDPDATDPKGVAPNFNYVSLNIELENLGDGKDPYTEKQLDAAAAQVVEWWGKYGYLSLLGHKHVDSRKSDPANFDFFAFSQRIDRAMEAMRLPPPPAAGATTEEAA